jgi:hypothetical protein
LESKQARRINNIIKTSQFLGAQLHLGARLLIFHHVANDDKSLGKEERLSG